MPPVLQRYVFLYFYSYHQSKREIPMLAKRDSDENKAKKKEDKHVCNICCLFSNGLRKRKLVINYSSENFYISVETQRSARYNCTEIKRGIRFIYIPNFKQIYVTLRLPPTFTISLLTHILYSINHVIHPLLQLFICCSLSVKCTTSI